MNTAAHRRGPSPALLAMLVVLGLPALAQAQLFPNMTVKRQRPPCAMEDPIYRVYRQQFYGYYPTQWRTFPPGWNLVSPEAATPAQLEEARRGIQKEIDATAALAPENGDEAAPEDDTEMPDVAPRNPNPVVPPVPRNVPSPFELNPGPPAEPSPLPSGDAPNASRPAPSEGLAAGDPLDTAPPLDDPAPSTSVESDTPPALPPIDGAISPGSTYAPREDDMPPPVANSIAPPTTAPRRKTLIGGLFDTMRGRRRR